MGERGETGVSTHGNVGATSPPDVPPRAAHCTPRTSTQSFVRFLARSLALLQDELPPAYRAVSAALDGRAVLLDVDRESVWVGSVPPRLELRARALPACICLTTSRAGIRALIRGEETLVDAIIGGRVELAGTIEDLIAFDGALMAYLHGAVRCPLFADLCDEYFADSGGARKGIRSPELTKDDR
jgi:hypothetical protein